ncbi:MAG TPA: restriction endonuclease [Longimicrobium sp.]|nr:restriction endonuclease [Longimicrobium sp.]
MPADYIDRIRRMDWHALRRLWVEIETGSPNGWPAGKALEHLVLRAFELSGATVRWPYGVSIDGAIVEQIDGAVHVRGLSCIVECKDTVEPTNTDAIARLRNQLLRRPAGAVGLMFSRAGFTPAAVAQSNFMAPQAILLWDGEEIAYLLEHEDFTSALVIKRRHSIEEGTTRIDIRQEVSL